VYKENGPEADHASTLKWIIKNGARYPSQLKNCTGKPVGRPPKNKKPEEICCPPPPKIKKEFTIKEEEIDLPFTNDGVAPYSPTCAEPVPPPFVFVDVDTGIVYDH